MPTPLEIAEDFTLYVPPRRGFLRHVAEEFVLTTGTSGATVARVRLTEAQVPAAVEEIRRLVRAEDVRQRVEWWCGPSATPAGLVDQLARLGLVPDEDDEELVVMLLEAPPAGEATAEVRRIETFEDYVLSQELDWEAWGAPDDLRERRRALLPLTWETSQEQGAAQYLGYLDGEPMGFGRMVLLNGAALLLGGSTLPQARGKGVYVSLVHRRWQDAVERGVPRLVVQAGGMSRPVLERLGFRPLGVIKLMVDRL